MLVGMSVGDTTVWKPLSCMSSCGGGGWSGFCSCWFRNTICVSTFVDVSLGPAVSVATTAPVTITVWSSSETMPTPKIFFFWLFCLDSIRTSNTGCASRASGYGDITQERLPASRGKITKRLQGGEGTARRGGATPIRSRAGDRVVDGVVADGAELESHFHFGAH